MMSVSGADPQSLGIRVSPGTFTTRRPFDSLRSLRGSGSWL